MRFSYGLIFLLISFSVRAQRTGEASTVYTEQGKLNSLASQKYNTICNSLVLTSDCQSDFPTLQEGEAFEIDCIYDLGGEVITLPSNVTLNYLGGDIINGELVFSDGEIDGRLLNHTLEVTGDVSLIDTVFNFYASRWDIVEGSTNSDRALQNNTNLEKLMVWIKELGANTFKIDKLDMYVEVTRVTSTTSNQNFYPALEGMNPPSDFNLIMTDNTHLRVFPGGNYNLEGGAIIGIRDAENITIRGGNFHGDRDERYFSPDDVGLEGCHLLNIQSGRNIILDGIYFENGSSGTLNIYSFGFSFNPETYNPTENVVIKNCTIKDSRRMSLALTDGRNIRIENNTFINSSQPSVNTDGGEVGYAINLEPARTRDDEGNLKEYQRVFDVLIKGNIETNSRGGFLTLTIGQDITVEDNVIDTRMVWSLVSGVKIRNNTFTASADASESWAFFGAGKGETVFDNEFSGNTISGYSAGVILGTIGVKVYDNVIKNCSAGVQLSKTFDTKVYNNTIDVTNNGVQATNTYCNDVEVTGNHITSGGFHFKATNLNNSEGEEEYSLLMDDNVFNGNDRAVSLSLINGLTFTNNEVSGGIEITNVTNSLVEGNTVKSVNRHGIRTYNTHKNLKVSNNTIYEPTGATRFECLSNESTTPDEVELVNNTCN